MTVEVLMGTFAMVSISLFACCVVAEVIDDFRELIR
jgi:hypothetical protein